MYEGKAFKVGQRVRILNSLNITGEIVEISPLQWFITVRDDNNNIFPVLSRNLAKIDSPSVDLNPAPTDPEREPNRFL
jgi:hypothetical protein